MGEQLFEALLVQILPICKGIDKRSCIKFPVQLRFRGILQHVYEGGRSDSRSCAISYELKAVDEVSLD